MNKETDLAYLACAIDGEGTVGAQLDPRNISHLAIRISIANSHHGFIDWLHGTFGGVIYNRKTYKDYHKPQKEWRVMGLDAIGLAKLAVPYAIIKKEQLELLIALEPLRNPRRKTTPEVTAQRIPIVDRITELNRRGSSQWINRPSWRRLDESS